ncbi:hypothetical protein HC891_08365 [Candidatus Gracilibacteria bacterium]|nr:hypothetical protein [Candidatus Gracilibacteria bacterium]
MPFDIDALSPVTCHLLHKMPQPDLEEMRPNLFVIHNPSVKVMLRGEGDVFG